MEKIHIGQLIKQKMEEDGRKVSWLAEKIPCSRSNVYRIFNSESINTEQLRKICKHLGIEPFSLYSEEKPKGK